MHACMAFNMIVLHGESDDQSLTTLEHKGVCACTYNMDTYTKLIYIV